MITSIATRDALDELNQAYELGEVGSLMLAWVDKRGDTRGHFIDLQGGGFIDLRAEDYCLLDAMGFLRSVAEASFD